MNLPPSLGVAFAGAWSKCNSRVLPTTYCVGPVLRAPPGPPTVLVLPVETRAMTRWTSYLLLNVLQLAGAKLPGSLRQELFSSSVWAHFESLWQA